MSDDVDRLEDREAIANEARVRAIQHRAILEPGAPGECDLCGEDSPRLVRGVCAPCRDRRKLP